jgi:hypothetical protein
MTRRLVTEVHLFVVVEMIESTVAPTDLSDHCIHILDPSRKSTVCQLPCRPPKRSLSPTKLLYSSIIWLEVIDGNYGAVTTVAGLL